MSELLPCPFCGGNDVSVRSDVSEDEPHRVYAYHGFCHDCHARGRNHYRIGWCESHQAACEAWNDRPVTAAQSAVNQLPWEEINRDRGDGGQDLAGWEADSGFGPFYEIEVGHSSFDVSYDCQKLGDFDDPDQAKKCAQDHFEKRIRAALTEGNAAQGARTSGISEGRLDFMVQYGDGMIRRSIDPLEHAAIDGGKMINELVAEVRRLRPFEDELLKIAADVGEPDDPFAAWERIRTAPPALTEGEPATGAEDPVKTICDVLCKSRVFETGQGTCALTCMDQLGDPRKRGCHHATRVHDKMAHSILEALAKRAGIKPPSPRSLSSTVRS